jgi:hypothetical protein
LINLPPVEYLPAWFGPGVESDENEEGSDADGEFGRDEDHTANREVDGVIPGEGEAKDHLVVGTRDGRNIQSGITGVG